MALQKLLGVETLMRNGSDEGVAVSSLEGKPVFLYFSAHWCPPCRNFTPIFAKVYKAMKEKQGAPDFEVIFVSADHSTKEFGDYFKGMPWLALPFDERKVAQRLNRKVKVSGIPTVAAVDAKGAVVSTKIRDRIMQDQEGTEFPWMPKTVPEVLKDATFMTHDEGKKLTAADLDGREAYVLYFAAQYSAPCRVFTPRLATTYERMRAAGTAAEVIFCSVDRSEEDFAEFWGEMPFAALPLADDRVRDLLEALSIENIPAVVTLKPDGTVINKDARDAVEADLDAARFPWAPVPPKGASPMDPSGPVVEALNNECCVIFDPNGAPNADTAKLEFVAAADAYGAEHPDDKVFFLTVDGAAHERLLSNVLRAVGASRGPHGQAAVLMMHLPNEATGFVPSQHLDRAAIAQRAAAFASEQRK